MKQMATRLLDHDTVTVPLQEVVRARPMAASPAKKSRSITATLAFLIGCVSLMMTGFAVIIPVCPQRLQALGLGSETLALMEGAFGLGMFLFSTPMGIWSGRIGRKPILFISLAGFILTNLLLAFVNVPLLFIPIRFVEGMLLSGLTPAAMSMVGDTIPLSKQGRWIGYLTTAQAVGFALGPGIGGLLSQTLGFTSPFLLSAAIALAASLVAVFMVPETLPKHVGAGARPHQPNRRELAQREQPWQDWTVPSSSQRWAASASLPPPTKIAVSSWAGVDQPSRWPSCSARWLKPSLGPGSRRRPPSPSVLPCPGAWLW